jgi:hypothetical protein
VEGLEVDEGAGEVGWERVELCFRSASRALDGGNGEEGPPPKVVPIPIKGIRLRERTSRR